MDDIYILSDAMVLNKVGNHLRTLRLKQNLTQQSLAEAANISLSTVKKMEKGEIRSFDAFLRVLRTLGRLDVLQPLVEELENPLETDPGIPLVIDPPLLFFSSDTQMQAVGIKNRSSLHSA